MAAQLLYFADPMCSWCWGFSPVVHALQDRYGTELPLYLILGGLAPGKRDPMTEAGKQEVRDHWQHVEAASGQPFDYGFFAREGFVYNTEPPSRAVVAARRLMPGIGVAYLAFLHRAFYAHNEDITDDAVLLRLAEEFGFAPGPYLNSYNAPETAAALERDFAASRNLGIRGFPALVGRSDASGFTVITLGFQSLAKIHAQIERWRNRLNTTDVTD